MSHRVQAALRRMEDGTYGVCLGCEEPISVRRIEAVPWASCAYDAKGCRSCRRQGFWPLITTKPPSWKSPSYRSTFV